MMSQRLCMMSQRMLLAIAVYLLLFLGATSQYQSSPYNMGTHQFRYDRTSKRLRSELEEHEALAERSVESLGEILKRQVASLRQISNRQVELVFIVDESGSVGKENFFHELNFVKKLLVDFTVDQNTTRVAVITFSSENNIKRQIDQLSASGRRHEHHKCSLLEDELPRINYSGGGTYTKLAFIEAQKVLQEARPTAQKVVFHITDGHTNGEDPVEVASDLKKQGVTIFTIGIQNGNKKELWKMASNPKKDHYYIVDSFEEFEALARRALHEDLQGGSYMRQPPKYCNRLCDGWTEGCCDLVAACRCGTHTGKYECVCRAGFYGNGLRGGCSPCPSGTYKNVTGPGDVTTCVKCPDINHESEPGSTSLSQCRCKKDFRDDGHHRCAAITCPALEAPENAEVLKGCLNNTVVNGICAMKCATGYFRSDGSTVRLCQDDGTWRYSPLICEVRKCHQLTAPHHGKMQCTNEDFLFNTECRFTCDLGYYLIGSSSKKCLPIGIWTGLLPKCKEVTCKPLPKLPGGKILPGHCTSRDMPFNTHCTLTCDPGFKLNVNNNKVCREDGEWSPKGEPDSKCVDNTPPEIQCPTDIVAFTTDNDNFAVVTWPEPEMKDNSGHVISTMYPTMSKPAKLPIGVTSVNFTAEDFDHNKATCVFTVSVIDSKPPQVERCISPRPFVMEGDGKVYVVWEEPVFWDNSRQQLKVTASHNMQQQFPVGQTKVIYTATDPSGNNNTCILNIVVKEHLCANPKPPLNGNMSCDAGVGVVECTLTCKAGYGFAIEPAEVYTCDQNTGTWYPDNHFPDCSLSRMSNQVVQKSRIVLKTLQPCDDSLTLEKLSQRIENRIAAKVSKLCDPNAICTVENFRTQCLDKNSYVHQDYDEWSNVIRQDLESDVLGRRKRRAIDPGTSYRLGVDFQIHGKILDKSWYQPRMLFDGTRESQQQLVTNVQSVLGNLSVDWGSDEPHDYGLETLALRAADPELTCPEGSIIKGLKCVNCPSGTRFNVQTAMCEGCPIGTYQREERQLTCQTCPNNTSTAHNHSKSINECKSQCLPGTFSGDGLEKCEVCPVGRYQTEYASAQCDSCPDNMTTLHPGSRTFNDCLVKCAAGHISKTGVEPCYPCPQGYFQHERGRLVCYMCPDGVPTPTKGSADLHDCQGKEWTDLSSFLEGQPNELSVNDCFSEPCENNATCQGMAVGYTCLCRGGWTGLHCESEIDECRGKPCMNNATCVDRLDDYLCQCSPGFTGKNCSVNIDECQSSPCRNNGSCQDIVDGFLCLCQDGFNGTFCEHDQDDCLAGCENNGTCIDGINSFTCRCLPGFTGKECETDVDECISNPCQHDAICSDAANGFVCECKAGYTGTLCEIEVNECVSSPCYGQATCVNQLNRYSCLCPPAYNGTHCEQKLKSDFHLEFPEARITDYAMLQGRAFNVTSLTVAFWMKSTDKSNYGTVLSYANSHTDNAITISDYSGFVFKVNDDETVTDVKANDGRWHHIAIKWTSFNGHWVIYKDGSIEQQGKNIGKGTTIVGGGMFVIGQEQDSVGGDFISRETFVGIMSGLHVWDRPLSSDEILGLFWCQDVTGSLLAWPDFLNNLNGHVQKHQSHFCEPCTVLQYPNADLTANFRFQTTIEPRSHVTYQCHKGYKLAKPADQTCMPYGWASSKSDHLCEKIVCRNLPIVPHAYIAAHGVTVTYACEQGYKMQGNSTLTCQDNEKWSRPNFICTEVICPSNFKQYREYKPGQTLDKNPCQHGFRLDTDKFIICQDDGTWSANTSCVKIKCPSPPSILNATVQTGRNQEFSIKDIVTYTCDVGFKIKCPIQYWSHSTCDSIECRPDGTWTPTKPICDHVTCVVPSYVQNGSVNVTQKLLQKKYTYGTLAVYTCDTGFHLVGNSTLHCNANGQWNDTTPSCSPLECSPLTEITRGAINSTKRSYQTTVGYLCDPGFTLYGVKARTCQSDGTWSSAEPSCKPIECFAPNAIRHGRVVGSNYTFEAIVEYSCVEGYLLSGPSVRQCLENGTWGDPIPQCVAVKCPRPHLLNGRTIDDTLVYFNDIMEYICDPEYNLIGPSTRRCLSNGTWSDEQPYCEKVTCPKAEKIEYGIVDQTLEKYVVGSVITYTCARGYELDGKASRTCRGDGTWSGYTPSCLQIRCHKPDDIEHGFLNSQGKTSGSTVQYQWTFGSTVQYQCDEGYQLDGPAERICTDDRHWSGTQPSCDAIICETPDKILHGTITTNEPEYRLGFRVIYECDKGYELQGDAERECLTNTSWSGTEPACFPVDCQHLSAIPHGKNIGQNFTFGATVKFVCENGYEIKGIEMLTCGANGDWDYAVPTCERITCPGPPIVTDCTITGDDFLYQSTVTYTCKDGFELIGPSTRECQSDRTWSGDTPKCVRIECPAPPGIDNGKVELKGIFFKNRVHYTCDPGYELRGEAYRECGRNKEWLGEDPVCVKIKCGAPPGIGQGKAKQKDVEYGEKVDYECEEGYVIDRPSDIACSTAGTYTGDTPQCVKVTCDDLQKIENGNIITNKNTYGEYIHYECRPGYTLVGESKRQCGPTGRWSGEAPYCEIIHCLPEPEDIEHGRMVSTDNTFGSRVTYVCDKGFQMEGTDTLTCLEDGIWSSMFPKCVQRECIKPDLPHMFISSASGSNAIEMYVENIKRFVPGLSVQLSCETGYVLDGTTEVTCTETGNWNTDLPRCSPISCQKPIIENGIVTGGSKYNERIFINCTKGYRVEGAVELYCKSDGRWSAKLPECVLVSCKEPYFYNGEFLVVKSPNRGTGYPYGIGLKFTCNPGYTREGADVVVCSDAGEWDYEIPHCSPNYCSFPKPADTEYHLSVASAKKLQYRYEETVEFKCDKHYELQGNNSMTCLASGKWLGVVPRCRLKVCDLPIIPNGSFRTPHSHNPNRLDVGSEITFDCNNGWKLAGEKRSTCLHDKTWSTETPVCERVKCNHPEIFNAINTTALAYSFEETFDVQCQEGFELDGPSTLTCGPDGSWVEKYPRCLKVICRNIYLMNGYVENERTNYEFGDRITVKCNAGFVINGPSQLTCASDSSWSPSFPTCSLVKCSRPVTHNGRVQEGRTGPIKQHFNYGQSIHIECDVGYNRTGSAESHCQTDGTWSSLATCHVVTCPSLDIDEAKLSTSDTTFGTTVNIVCNVGFQLIGAASITCDSQGQWSSLPSCKIIVCPAPSIAHGKIVAYKSFENDAPTFGDSVRFVCNEGYELVGEPEMVCQPDNRWSANFPYCRIISCGTFPVINALDDSVTSKTNFTFGQSVTVQCPEGFKIEGDAILKCGPSGSWKGKAVCEPVICTPIEIKNGYITTEDSLPSDGMYPYLMLIEYKCNPGYFLVGQPTAMCGEDGRWTENTPKCVQITCSIPEIHKGYVTAAYGHDNQTFYVNDVVHYHCSEGYVVSGDTAHKCTVDGNWDGPHPTCVLVICPKLKIANAKASPGSTAFGDTAVVLCKEGYELMGSSSVACQADGTWLDEPYCHQIRCPDPPSIINGEFRADTFTYGSTVIYSCWEGYELVGRAEHECLANKSWSGIVPSCGAIECHKPLAPANGYVNTTKFIYRSVAEYHCREGFKLVGDKETRCQANKQWSHGTPQCVFITCDRPDQVEYAVTVGDGWSFGDVAAFECIEGYEMQAAGKRTCTEEGWKGDQPVCVPVLCTTLESPVHGYIITTALTYNSTVTYMCDNGYELEGHLERVCQANGAWSGTVPRCQEIQCPAPEKPANGNLIGSDNTYKAVVEYVCNKGFDLIGDRIRSCKDDKQWSGTQPACRKKLCPKPTTISHGFYKGEDFTFGAEIAYGCDQKYELVGRSMRMCESDGVWSGEEPKCHLLQCPAPPLNDHTLMLGDDTSVGSSVSFQCDQGYQLIGDSTLKCTDGRNWNGHAPRCDKLSCGLPKIIEKGQLDGNSYQYKDIVKFKCLQGYEIKGNPEIRCQANATWTPIEAECVPISCGEPSQLEHGFIIGNSYMFNDFIYYRCKEGYDLDGNNLLQCGEDGMWIGLLPRCIMVTCGHPPIIHYASNIVRKTSFGSKVMYHCNRGYILFGSPLVECMGDKHWKFVNKPKCVPVNCGEPPVLLNGIVIYPDTTLHNVAKYQCDEGFTPSAKSNMIVQCGAEAKWNGSAPVCQRNQCHQPSRPDRGGFSGEDFAYNSTITFWCDEGFVLQGAVTATCQPNGTWSAAPPDCQSVSCPVINVSNGKVNTTSVHYGVHIEVLCDAPYVVEGNNVLECRDTGQWDKPMPYCVLKRQPCPSPSLPESAVQPKAKFYTGDTWNIQCQQGYFPTINATIQCLPNATWTEYHGLCSRMSCGPPDIEGGVLVMGNGYDFGNRLVYMCRAGFEPQRSTIITCRLDGTWYPTPICTAKCLIPCQNGGECIGFNKCKCPPGFTGMLCQKAQCILPCLNGGACTGPYKCHCPHGFTGARCQKPVCEKSCLHSGICIMPNRCRCPHGYSPPFCEQLRGTRKRRSAGFTSVLAEGLSNIFHHIFG